MQRERLLLYRRKRGGPGTGPSGTQGKTGRELNEKQSRNKYCLLLDRNVVILYRVGPVISSSVVIWLVFVEGFSTIALNLVNVFSVYVTNIVIRDNEFRSNDNYAVHL